MKAVYKSKKTENVAIFEQFIDYKIETSKIENLVETMGKIKTKYLPKLDITDSKKDQILKDMKIRIIQKSDL